MDTVMIHQLLYKRRRATADVQSIKLASHGYSQLYWRKQKNTAAHSNHQDGWGSSVLAAVTLVPGT